MARPRPRLSLVPTTDLIAVKSRLLHQKNTIPFVLRDLTWEVLARLAQDPNPSEEHEDRYGGENMDPLTLSLNTNRGEAMHAVIEYALWVHRSLEASSEDTSVGFEVIEEVRGVLERHLLTESEELRELERRLCQSADQLPAD